MNRSIRFLGAIAALALLIPSMALAEKDLIFHPKIPFGELVASDVFISKQKRLNLEITFTKATVSYDGLNDDSNTARIRIITEDAVDIRIHWNAANGAMLRSADPATAVSAWGLVWNTGAPRLNGSDFVDLFLDDSVSVINAGPMAFDFDADGLAMTLDINSAQTIIVNHEEN